MVQEIDTDSFAKTIEKEIASIEIERKRAAEAQALEQKKHDEACRLALRVRDEVILPLLNGLRDAFAKAKFLLGWEVTADGNMEAFSGSCQSHPASQAELNFRIKAEVAVQDKGDQLGFSVVCECEDPLKTAEKKNNELYKSESYSVAVVKFEMTNTRRWYYRELEKCAVACVREKHRPAA